MDLLNSINVNRTDDWRCGDDWMIRNKNDKKLAFLGWHRSHITQPAPEYECVNCHLNGHCHTSEMCREVNVFGILIRQTRQIIECSRCSNAIVVGSMDLPLRKNSEAEPANFDLPNFSEDERLALRAVVGQKVKMNYSNVAKDSNAGVTN